MRRIKNLLVAISCFWSTTANAQSVCPSGYPLNCGNGYCCPSGSTCGASGTCYQSSGSSSGSGNPPQTGGGTAICSPVSAGAGCSDAQACVDDTDGKVWYQAGGRFFYCGATSCEGAADQLAQFCSAPAPGGCSTSPGPANNAAVSVGLTLLAIIIARRFIRETDID